MGKLIGVVILNYKSYWETIECVEATLKQNYKNYQIVIVENGSGNESYQILKDKYEDAERITILESKENLGFARGNNVGIRYAREVLHCDYVFVTNSDIVFEPDLFEQITAVDITDVGVINPSIYSLKNEQLLPSGRTNNVYRKFFRTIFDIFVTSMLLLEPVQKLYQMVKHSHTEEAADNVVEQSASGNWKYAINGCAFFLTENFFKYYTQMYPKTFLYWEEMNILIYLQKAGLISKDVETSPVIHKEGRSTRKVGEKIDMHKVLKQSRDSLRKSWYMYFMPYSMIKRKYN